MADSEILSIDNMELLICSSEEKLTKKNEKYRELKLKRFSTRLEWIRSEIS